MNANLIESIQLYNQRSSNQVALPVDKMRNYFLTKAELASSIDEAYWSLKGLNASKDMPFLSVQASVGEKVSSGTISAKDFMGKSATFNHEIDKVELVSKTGNVVNIHKQSKLDKEQGIIKFAMVKDLQAGIYQAQVTTKSGQVFKSCDSFEVKSELRFNSAKYELSESVLH